MFIVGVGIFAIFLISDVSEFKTDKKDNDGYYARHQPEKDELN